MQDGLITRGVSAALVCPAPGVLPPLCGLTHTQVHTCRLHTCTHTLTQVRAYTHAHTHTCKHTLKAPLLQDCHPHRTGCLWRWHVLPAQPVAATVGGDPGCCRLPGPASPGEATAADSAWTVSRTLRERMGRHGLPPVAECPRGEAGGSAPCPQAGWSACRLSCPEAGDYCCW